MMKKYLRDKFFWMASRELAQFLEDHEADLLLEVRKQLEKMDDEIPEEKAFIDVKMVPLGEAILKASLAAIREFLKGHAPPGKQ